MGKPNNLKVFGGNKSKEPKRPKSEDNLRFDNTFVIALLKYSHCVVTYLFSL